MSAQEVIDQNFSQEVLESEKAVLVDFWAPWCGPCQIQGPIVDEVAEAVKDTAKVVKMNVDVSQTTAQQYGIMSIPTLMIFKAGKPVEQMVGVHEKDDLVGKLKAIA